MTNNTGKQHRENDSSLLAETKRGAMGMGQKMRNQRNSRPPPTKEPDYILPSESDDTGIDSQGSSWTLSSVGTGNWTAATMGTNYTTDSAYLETILRGDDLNYVKQKYGHMSIVISTLQLFFLVMVIALCGLAPLNINPAIGPYPDALSFVGGTNSFAIFKEFQIWRYVTTPLLNAGILQFLCIVGIQLELGAFFEREWGSNSWLIIYALSSFGSTLCDASFNANGISVGSAGPLVGLFGAKISEIIMMMNFKTTDSYLIDGMHQLFAILFTLFFVSLLTFFPYVEWSGHLGGFVTGFIAGMIVLCKKIKHKNDRKVWFGLSLILGTITFISAIKHAFSAQPNNDLADACEYYANVHPENYVCQCAL